MTDRTKPLSVYLLTGQSNSLGTTCEETSYGPGEVPSDETTEFFWSNVNCTNTQFPPNLYGDSAGEVTHLQVQQGDQLENPIFWGPEFGFVRTLQSAYPEKRLIVKASRGGGNTFWSAKAFQENPHRGHMWGHLAAVLRQTLGSLALTGRPFRLKGLLYIQGESNDLFEAEQADARLEELIDGVLLLSNDLLPNSAAEMHTVVGEIAASRSSATRELTTERQASLASRRRDVSFVRTNDLPLKPDGIHFDRFGKLEIGRRFAQEITAGSSASMTNAAIM